MAIIIDRRSTANRDRTSENRGRLLRRYKRAIKEQLPRILGDRKLLDSVRGGGGKVILPKKDLSEPQFVYGDGGGSVVGATTESRGEWGSSSANARANYCRRIGTAIRNPWLTDFKQVHGCSTNA